MKRSIYIILLSCLISIGLAGCKEEPAADHGSVSLKPGELELKYNEEKELTPSYSESGNARYKSYLWKNSNENTVSHQVIAGGKLKVKGLRIGEATITYFAEDGSIFAESKINVNARTTLLGNIRFNPGESSTTVKNRVPWTLNERESKDNLLVYDVVGQEKIKQEIYYFENDKLFSLLVILADSKENETEAQEYIEERFAYIASGADFTYYNAGISPDYRDDTVVGIFLPDILLPKEKISGKLGVRYTTEENLKK